MFIDGLPDSNDLISCLAQELRAVAPSEPHPEVIVNPSKVVAFQLVRHYASNDRQKFTFPAYFYLDQFMHEKAVLADEKRQVRRDLLGKVADLEARRKVLTKFQARGSRLTFLDKC